MSRQSKNRKKAARTKAAKNSSAPGNHFHENEKPSHFPHMQQKAAWMTQKRKKKSWHIKGTNNRTVPKQNKQAEAPTQAAA